MMNPQGGIVKETDLVEILRVEVVELRRDLKQTTIKLEELKREVRLLGTSKVV